MKLSYSGLISSIFLSCVLVLCSFLLSPQHALAAGFSFDQIGLSNHTASDAGKAPPENAAVIHLQNEEDMQKLAQALQLNDAQRDGIVKVIKAQIPIIEQNMHSLNLAHSMLMSMATNKSYDEFIANSAADQIAKSSATLGILQAEREFKIYSILTADQAKKFDSIQTTNIIQLM